MTTPDVLQDVNGGTSSKRVAAFVGLAIMAAVSIYAIIKDPAQVANILWPWAVVVGALLGVTVLERKQ
jgi:hypothetical protein